MLPSTSCTCKYIRPTCTNEAKTYHANEDYFLNIIWARFYCKLFICSCIICDSFLNSCKCILKTLTFMWPRISFNFETDGFYKRNFKGFTDFAALNRRNFSAYKSAIWSPSSCRRRIVWTNWALAKPMDFGAD